MTKRRVEHKVRMMELLVLARKYTDAKDLSILSVLRKHLPTPLVDERTYFNRTAIVKENLKSWTSAQEEGRRGKVQLSCLDTELDTLFNAPSFSKPVFPKADGNLWTRRPPCE